MGFLTNFFYNLLVLFTAVIPGHYIWISIVLITLIIRFVFVKPTYSMLKTQNKQKGVQKHLNEIKEKYKDDKAAQQKAIMELYKEQGINPLGSCLPLIAQMVLLIGFYGVFRLGDLAVLKPELLYDFVPKPDSLNVWFFGVNLSQTVAEVVKGPVGWVGFIFPVLTAGTQLFQSFQSRSLQPKSQEGDKTGDMMKAMNTQMVYFFPLITAYISYTLPTALSIYWITQTVFMVVQQHFIIKKFQTEEIVAEEVAEAIGAKDIKQFKKGGVNVTVREKK